jgi:trimeric autotransporter adhesin
MLWIPLLLMALACGAPAQCGLQWASLPGGPQDPSSGAIAVGADGSVHLVGWQDSVNFTLGYSRWDGTVWTTWPNVFTNYVADVVSMPDGSLVACGGNSLIATENTFVRWNGSAWTSLPTLPVQYVSGDAYCLTVMPNGDLVAAGHFSLSGQTTYVMRYDGTQWTAMPPVPGYPFVFVSTLRTLANGDLLTGSVGGTGPAFVHRWNGATWSMLGTFSPTGSGNTGINGACELPDGRIVVTGLFSAANGQPASCVAIYDGSNWHALGSGISGANSAGFAVEALPNGDLLLGGLFTSVGGIAANNVARWNGNAWAALGAGLGGGSGFGAAWRIRNRPQGDVVVLGFFTQAGGLPANQIARLVPPCPATATVLGAGCSSTAGPMRVTVTSLPWAGGTFRSTTTGITPGGLAFGLVGFVGTSTPLSALHPAGLPGCNLYVDPILSLQCASAAGVATFALALPSLPALVGVGLRHQVLQAELGLQFAITALAASDAISMTVGTL